MSFNSKVVYGDTVLIDLTSDNVMASVLLKGYTAHGADGAPITGTAEGASSSEEIDRIFSLLNNSEMAGSALTKTFSNNGTTCTTIFKNQNGIELGRTVKVYSNDCRVITTTDSEGRKLVKTFSTDFKTCEYVLTDSNDVELVRIAKTLSDDGSVTNSVIAY